MPGELITDGMLVLLAGGLLVAPGLITDTIGISLLVPLCRNWYKKRTIEYLKERFNVTTFTAPAPPSAGADVVDGEVVDGSETAPSERDSQSSTLPRTIEGEAKTDLPTD